MDDETALLRHTLATLAYRGGKALQGAPAEFAEFSLAAPRTPGQILAHIGDLMDWALTLADGNEAWHDSPPLTWDKGTARFFAALEAFDRRLASAVPPACRPEKLFQGAIADALTHVGQIAMLRRLAGCPFHGENYYLADIAAGRVGAEQAKPVAEF
ncbi:MAG: hypothetical protein ABSH42_16245 [Bryobacteraceae bacterium]|jgi:hypothetical protein